MSQRGVVGDTLDSLGDELIRIERRLRKITRMPAGKSRVTLTKVATTQVSMLLHAYGDVRARIERRMKDLGG